MPPPSPPRPGEGVALAVVEEEALGQAQGTALGLALAEGTCEALPSAVEEGEGVGAPESVGLGGLGEEEGVSVVEGHEVRETTAAGEEERLLRPPPPPPLEGEAWAVRESEKEGGALAVLQEEGVGEAEAATLAVQARGVALVHALGQALRLGVGEVVLQEEAWAEEVARCSEGEAEGLPLGERLGRLASPGTTQEDCAM